MSEVINYDPNSNRESYLKAFEEFKQRRKDSTAGGGGGDDGSSSCSTTGKIPLPDSTDNSSDIYSTVSRIGHHRDDGSGGPSDYGYDDGCSAGEEYSTIISTATTNNNNRKKRHSMPAKMHAKATGTTTTKSKRNIDKNSSINNVIHEHEIDQFENLHCNKLPINNGDSNADVNQTYFVGSPPGKFFKFNSKPFEDSVEPHHEPTLTNEQFQCGGQPSKIPMGGSGAESTDSYLSGSYRHFDNGGGSEADRGDIELNTTATVAATVTPAPVNASKKYRRKKGSGYRFEHQINKYGDVVEYAMPEAVSSYSEDRDTDSPTTMTTTHQRDRSPIPLPPDYSPPTLMPPANSFVTNCGDGLNVDSLIAAKKQHSMMITDLDESMDLDYGECLRHLASSRSIFST